MISPQRVYRLVTHNNTTVSAEELGMVAAGGRTKANHNFKFRAIGAVTGCNSTALRPIQDFGEVDTQPHRPSGGPQLPREQAGFRRGRSTMDQVTLLTQHIEDSFEHNEKAGVVFLDLTAAYDTVWHRGLHLKLLRIIPDRQYGGFHHGDVVKLELRSEYQRRTTQYTQKNEEWCPAGFRSLTDAV